MIKLWLCSSFTKSVGSNSSKTYEKITGLIWNIAVHCLSLNWTQTLITGSFAKRTNVVEVASIFNMTKRPTFKGYYIAFGLGFTYKGFISEHDEFDIFFFHLLINFEDTRDAWNWVTYQVDYIPHCFHFHTHHNEWPLIVIVITKMIDAGGEGIHHVHRHAHPGRTDTHSVRTDLIVSNARV